MTQAEYEQVTGDNPSNFTGDGWRPVETVMWLDAVKFCNQPTQPMRQRKPKRTVGQFAVAGYYRTRIGLVRSGGVGVKCSLVSSLRFLGPNSHDDLHYGHILIDLQALRLKTLIRLS